MSNCELINYAKYCLQKAIKFGFLTQLIYSTFLLEMQENVKKLNFERDCAGCDKIIACSDNPGQNIFNKIEKSSKIEQDKKCLMSGNDDDNDELLLWFG